MRKEDDFTNAKPNPYVKNYGNKFQYDLMLIQLVILKNVEETGIAYQNLINLYLSDCAIHSRNINIVWK